MSIAFTCRHQSDNTALLLACEAQIGAPVYAVAEHDYDAPAKAAREGAISAFMECWKGSAWDDAGTLVHESLAGVLMPAPSAHADTGHRVGFHNDEVRRLRLREWLLESANGCSLYATTRARSRCGICSASRRRLSRNSHRLSQYLSLKSGKLL